ncbi:MAG: YihA family ribosome biogenesis GTP-binding protein [Pseudarcicella sp.]|nr:YihA family ribosome biogenesis GTP-binding protein [Pseudarcicella sp.]MBP6410719.1 YihA family ribosome biogenesis GTP-binding protein [Pseudarcicella sp.]
MKISQAVFLQSNSDYLKCPTSDKPEYAFIGRSNVGKSSLINCLVQKKGLAKTSQTPGKTLLINHFLINNEWHLVDLPGFGYAKVSKEDRSKLENIIYGYLHNRPNLLCTFVLIDVRHEPQKIDLVFMERLANRSIPFYMVFTKTDKLSATKVAQNIEIYKNTMLEQWEEMPQYFVTSSVNNLGREEILRAIAEMNAERLS